ALYNYGSWFSYAHFCSFYFQFFTSFFSCFPRWSLRGVSNTIFLSLSLLSLLLLSLLLLPPCRCWTPLREIKIFFRWLTLSNKGSLDTRMNITS
ncbi:hypothetical protein GQ43DRAFT_491080, partial [Delitschia confertaspora ATCC 74209]